VLSNPKAKSAAKVVKVLKFYNVLKDLMNCTTSTHLSMEM